MLIAKLKAGDKLIGLASSGPHSNGYSLIRKIIDHSGQALDSEFGDSTLGETLLAPTRIYVKPVLSVLRRYRNKRPVHALSHITGGGLIENIPRSIPKSCDVTIRKKSWEPPAIFRHLAKRGRIPPREMFRVFNMGIGMVMIVSEFFAESILSQLDRMKVPAAMIGEVTRGKGRVKFK